MKKTSTTKKRITPFFIAFLAVAVLFLAIGIGTLGSFTSTGDDYEFRAPVLVEGGDQQNSAVVFRLNSSISETYTDEDGEEATHTVYLTLADVYLYVTAIYSEVGTPAGLSVRRSTSGTGTYGGQVTASLENLYTPAPAEGEEAPAVQTDVLYRWVHPFTFSTKWSIGTYNYWEIYATSASMRIGEVLFVGAVSSTSDSAPAQRERYIVPAAIYSATPNTGETMETARERATALIDCDINLQVQDYVESMADEKLKGTVALPEIPAEPTSSYDTFTKAEISSLLTVTEMRVGEEYMTDANNRVTNVYHVENVYNVLGMDLVALGTEMFGLTPFGLRFMPMLFSFGILVLGYFFVKRLFKSDRAGFVFALLYALCDLSFAFGHLGTPLTAGVFFVLLAAYCVDSFYRRGMKRVSLLGLAPLFFGGLASAAAICVNGALLIPVLGVCALYVAGMLRQQKANKYYLQRAVEACEEKPLDEEGNRDTREVAKVIAENRTKNFAAGFVFPVALVLGAFVLALLCLLPVYAPLVKFYDDPTSSTVNMFSIGWKAFAGGFVGKHVIAEPSAWSLYAVLFKGTGASYATTVAVINAVAAVCALIGVAYAVYKVVHIALHFSEEGKELRRILPPLVGIAVCLVCTALGGAFGAMFLAHIFGFMLAAYAAEDNMVREGTLGKAAKIVTIVALVLLLVCFGLFAVFTFSVPMPAGFMAKFF